MLANLKVKPVLILILFYLSNFIVCKTLFYNINKNKIFSTFSDVK